ncbi:hypothetical protein [Streptococcus jiangjianxini]|uniref:hypothetical protein n=1 Tax=Streptococcus jiangjianxini TaxID=3161189 RepID=UPI0032EDB6C7
MKKITEYIQFGNFNSKDLELYLVERDAPTPNEKEIIEDIPFMQGVLDFSMILGERIFKNREITYKFIAVDKTYAERKVLERAVKRLTMLNGKNNIYDTHNNRFYWFGKCKSVEVEDDTKYNTIQVTIVFDCYPFLYSFLDYFDDYFDDFDLDAETAAYTKFPINGVTTIKVYNTGDSSVSPTIITSTAMSLKDESGKEYQFDTGTSSDYELVLKKGENIFEVNGYGTIAFHYASEVMG